MSYKFRVKKYMDNASEKDNPNPYQATYDERDKKTSELYGIWCKPCSIGVDGFDDIPYFYIEFEEVQDELLLKCRKATTKKTRSLKPLIKELGKHDIEVKVIVPLFTLDSDDLTKILTGDWEGREFKYLSKDKERFGKYGESYVHDDDETYNYMIELDCLKGYHTKTEYFVLKEIEDLEYILEELK